MNPRTIPPLLALAALAAATPASAVVRHTERSDRAVESGGLRALEVDNPRGDVEVTPSPDGRLHVTAIKTCRGRDRAEAQRYAAQVNVTTVREGDRFVIRVSYPKRVDVRINFWELFSGRTDEDDFGPSHDVRLQLRAPVAMNVSLESVSGDLAVRGLAGTHRLRSTSGDCAVETTRGAVELKTVSGDARLRGGARAVVRTTSGDIDAQPGGPLDAASISGDIDVEGAPDSLVLETTSGDIAVDAAPRGIHAESSSGSIRAGRASGRVELGSTSGGISVALAAPLRQVEISNSSGNVSIAFEPGLGASLELATTSGDIECDVPVVLLGHGRHHMNARIGRGGAGVKVRTVSGDLHVTSGGR